MKIAITGGCGFLGTNVALRLMSRGHSVVCVDNFSRRGSEWNGATLKRAGACVKEGDFPYFVYKDFDVVLHYAAQVTVSESLEDPYGDFQTNVSKTLMMLDNIGRDASTTPVFIYASTNKVYGQGSFDLISEDFPLGYTSPYALSKGTADNYFTMLGHLGDLSSIVLRQSCLYGSYQYGIEGQGWLAWFLQKIAGGETLTIFGDGQQVRDVLEVRDYANLIVKIIEHPNLRQQLATGEVFNVGGGVENALSLMQAVDIISGLTKSNPTIRFEAGRLGDQQHYVSDIEKANTVFNWQPKISPERGLTDLLSWVQGRVPSESYEIIERGDCERGYFV